MNDNRSNEWNDGLSDEDVSNALADLEAGFSSDFEAELDELTGEKAREAIILTPFVRTDVLAACCSSLSVSAWCVESGHGAFAVLREPNGSAPEDGAAALSKLAPVVLLVNRGNKLNAQAWQDGAAGETLAPPLVFINADPLVEDLMIGVATNEELAAMKTVTDSASLTPRQVRSLLRSVLRDYFHKRHGKKGSEPQD